MNQDDKEIYGGTAGGGTSHHQLVVDPKLQAIKDLGPYFMEVHALEPHKLPSLLRQCIDAWSPKMRSARRRHFMHQRTPIADIFWHWWHGTKFGKANKPKGFKIDFDQGVHLFREDGDL